MPDASASAFLPRASPSARPCRSVRVANPRAAEDGQPATLVRKVAVAEAVAEAVPHAQVARWPGGFRVRSRDGKPATPIPLPVLLSDAAGTTPVHRGGPFWALREVRGERRVGRTHRGWVTSIHRTHQTDQPEETR